MKIIIFGATGNTGIKLVEQALAQGHNVTAFARNPAKMSVQHPNLTVAKGDVLDAAAVERALPGHEAVFSTLGAPGSDKSNVRSQGTRNIIAAMQKHNVRRFICMTTIGMGDSKSQLPPLFKFVLVPFFLKEAFADSERQEQLIRQSGLDWTIVRPGGLTDGERTGSYRHGFGKGDKGLKFRVSRADVADFMLKQLTDDKYLRKTPGLSY
jgi:putative NADH-flavin reductase